MGKVVYHVSSSHIHRSRYSVHTHTHIPLLHTPTHSHTLPKSERGAFLISQYLFQSIERQHLWWKTEQGTPSHSEKDRVRHSVHYRALFPPTKEFSCLSPCLTITRRRGHFKKRISFWEPKFKTLFEKTRRVKGLVSSCVKVSWLEILKKSHNWRRNKVWSV